MPDLLVRLFNALVTPVGSYCCQVWGVEHLKFDSKESILNNPMVKIQLRLMRYMANLKKSTPCWPMFKEFGILPMRRILSKN